MKFSTQGSMIRSAIKTGLSFMPPGEGRGNIFLTAKKGKRDDNRILIEVAAEGCYSCVAVPADIEEEGSVVVDSKIIQSIVFKDRVDFSSDKSRLSFASGRSRGHLEIGEEDLLKQLDSYRKVRGDSLLFPAKSFISLAEKVRLANTPTDGTLVRLQIEKGTVTVAVTDQLAFGAALATLTPKWAKKLPTTEVVLQASIFSAIGKMLYGESEAELTIDGATIVAKQGHSLVRLPVVDSPFPPALDKFLASFKKDNPKEEFQISTAALAEAVAITCGISEAETELAMTLAKGKVVVRVQSPSSSVQHSIALPKTAFKERKNPVVATCYAKQFADLIGVVAATAEKVTVGIHDNFLTINSEGKKNNGVLYEIPLIGEQKKSKKS